MAKKNTPGNRAEDKAPAAAKRDSRREKAAHQAAMIKSERAARERKERFIIGGVVAVVLALIIGGVAWQLSRNSGPVSAPAATSDFGFTTGDADAETHVEIFADYLCPACKSFEAATDADLTAALESGDTRVTYYPVVILDGIGDYSARAANAMGVVLDTAGVEVALEFNRALFAEQPAESGPMPDDEWLIDLAVKSGAEESSIRDGIEDEVFSRWVKEATQSAEKRGMNSTPTVFIDDKKLDPGPAAAAIAELATPQEG